MSAPNGLGPLVRLWGIRTRDLPPQSATADELAPFFASILREAVPFIDSAAPKSAGHPPRDNNNNNGKNSKLWTPKGVRSHPDSAARVEVSERVVPARDLLEVVLVVGGEKEKGGKKMKKKLGPETWACRRSVHADAARRGAASWAEFERCFRDDHAESERRFTPNVARAREALRWGGCAGVEVEVEVEDGPGLGGRWARFGLAVVEMRHKVGRPVLKDRTFPVLQMTCALVAGGEEEEEEKKEFLVVSIPVPDFGAASGASVLAREAGAQVASYVSVERVRKLSPGTAGGGGDGDGDGSGGDIEWLMATASDAAGVLPMWLQNMAMPGVIWKDVPLFLRWIAGEREKGDDKDKGKGKSRDQGTVSAGTGLDEG